MKGADFFYLLTDLVEPSMRNFVFLNIEEIYDVIYHPQQGRIRPYSVQEEKTEAHWTLYIQSSPSFHILFIGKDRDLFISPA